MKNGHGRGGKLKCIAISTGDKHDPAPTLLFGDGRGEEVVGLKTWSLCVCEAARSDDLRQYR
jgi:hypothetical protein